MSDNAPRETAGALEPCPFPDFAIEKLLDVIDDGYAMTIYEGNAVLDASITLGELSEYAREEIAALRSSADRAEKMEKALRRLVIAAEKRDYALPVANAEGAPYDPVA